MSPQVLVELDEVAISITDKSDLVAGRIESHRAAPNNVRAASAQLVEGPPEVAGPED
jgi:hypothetical protein